MIDLRDAWAKARSSPRRDPTIRSRVTTLIAIALLPFIGLLAWLGIEFAAVQRHVIEVQRVEIANNLTHLLDRELAAIQGTLIGLGSSEALSAGDFERFRRHADGVVDLPDIEAIRVYAPTGDIVFTTQVTSEPPVPAKDRANIINLVFRGQTIVSDIHADNNAERPIFSVTVPVTKNGSIAFAISADVLPDRLNTLFSEAGVKADWVSAIVDRTGHFVARSLNPQQFIGKLARPEVAAAAEGLAAFGGFKNMTHEGSLMGNSFRRSPFSQWTSVVAVPKEILDAPFRQSVTYLLLGGTAITLLSLALASLMAARISEPVRRLRNAATAVIEGRALPETNLRIAELSEVRVAFEHAVSKSAHLAAIVASSGDAIMSVGLDGNVRSWNQGAERLFGYTAEEMIGNPKSIIVPDNRIDELDRHVATIAAGESARAETLRKTRDGTLINVSLDMAPILDADDRIIAMSLIIHDITNRKETERHQRFLMRELTHRSKNLLAIVQSMARQTARSAATLKDFETQYMQRLQGLAASHDLLVNQNWVGVPLDELVRKQVQPFVETNRANLAISGPNVIVSARAAQNIGLALHELATNSIKYGALSTPKGKVSVDWEYRQSAGEPALLQLKWEEFDGPPVMPPARKGFGHFVIERMATQSLNAKVEIDFRPEGLIWTLIAPTDSLQSDPEFEGGDTIV